MGGLSLRHCLLHRSFARVLLARVIVIWIGVRVALRFLGLGLEVEPSVGLGIVVLSAGLACLDARRTNEQIFLANLGVPFAAIAVLASAPPLVFEVVIASWPGP